MMTLLGRTQVITMKQLGNSVNVTVVQKIFEIVLRAF